MFAELILLLIIILQKQDGFYLMNCFGSFESLVKRKKTNETTTLHISIIMF